MYADGVEALLWDSAEECAARCHASLADPAGRRQIAENGRRRVEQLRLANDDIAAAVLARLGQTDAAVELALPPH